MYCLPILPDLSRCSVTWLWADYELFSLQCMYFMCFLIYFLEMISYIFWKFSLPICSAYRTPICKSKRGGFKDTYPEDLLAPVLKVCLKHLLVFVLGCWYNSKQIKQVVSNQFDYRWGQSGLWNVMWKVLDDMKGIIEDRGGGCT